MIFKISKRNNYLRTSKQAASLQAPVLYMHFYCCHKWVYKYVNFFQKEWKIFVPEICVLLRCLYCARILNLKVNHMKQRNMHTLLDTHTKKYIKLKGTIYFIHLSSTFILQINVQLNIFEYLIYTSKWLQDEK